MTTTNLSGTATELDSTEESSLSAIEDIEGDDAEESIAKKIHQTDYDGAWKEILDRYMPAFIDFFFPDVYKQIDWSRGYEVLDQELNKIARDSKIRKRLTDKLVKVWRYDGTEHWVLIHIEIQSQQEKGFEQRVYVYFYRLRDYRDLPVATFVVLGDTTKDWKPSKYEEELWGTKLSFEYPVVKLREYWDKWDELEQSKNPFATVVMAHLQAQKSHNDPTTRYDLKLNLTRRLYKLGYKRDEVDGLFRFIDWLMWLPDELELDFWHEVEVIEEGEDMRYMHTGERLGYRRGWKEASERLREEIRREIQDKVRKEIHDEILEKGREEGILQSKRETIMSLADHLFELQGGSLKQKIEERVGLITSIDELATLMPLMLRQPVLDSFMMYLPELDDEMISDESPLPILDPNTIETEE